VLVAPENGKVMFISSLQENELISSGQSLFYIQPDETPYYAELLLSQRGLGKVKMGQRVILKPEGYPGEEYGHLNGFISYISYMPNRRDSFLAKLNLPMGLKTNYNKDIFFRNNLSASAQVITDDRKLFDRLLGQLNKVWER
jgi:HlyD family secretion protein